MSRRSAAPSVSYLRAATGLLILVLAASPAFAQTRAPAERESWSNESQKPASPPSGATEQSRTPRQRAAEPPVRRNDEFDPPPAGCQYRGNKLDLLV